MSKWNKIECGKCEKAYHHHQMHENYYPPELGFDGYGDEEYNWYCEDCEWLENWGRFNPKYIKLFRNKKNACKYADYAE